MTIKVGVKWISTGWEMSPRLAIYFSCNRAIDLNELSTITQFLEDLHEHTVGNFPQLQQPT